MKGRHQSVDKHLKKNILWIEKLPGVQKVILGISEACRHKYPPGHIRFRTDVEGGLKAIAYSGTGVTDVFIRIDSIENREHVKAMILARF